LEAYRHALKLVPDYLPALEGAAQIEYSRNDPDAISLLRRILALRPADPTAHAMLAVLEYKSADCKDAVADFQQAQPVIRSQFVSVSEYGICLAKLDRLDEAATVLQQALDLDATGHVGRYNLALVLWEAKRYDDAIQILTPDIESKANDEETLALAADIYEARNDTPHAVELLRRAIVANPLNTRAYLSFAAVSSEHASYQVGIDMLDAGLARMPHAAELYLARGVLYAQLSNFDNAMNDFQLANQYDPNLSFADTAEGIAQTQKRDMTQALTKFREEARLHPANAFNQYLLAETLAQQGTQQGTPAYNEELHAATRAVQLDPHLALAQNLLASLYFQSGKTALAIEHCNAVLQFDPNNQEALYHLILGLRQSGQKDEIASLTKRLVSLRAADKERQAHLVQYQLVDTATDSGLSHVEQ
jgi:tetratricopeptide (TPR) repeat protein